MSAILRVAAAATASSATLAAAVVRAPARVGFGSVGGVVGVPFCVAAAAAAGGGGGGAGALASRGGARFLSAAPAALASAPSSGRGGSRRQRGRASAPSASGPADGEAAGVAAAAVEVDVAVPEVAGGGGSSKRRSPPVAPVARERAPAPDVGPAPSVTGFGELGVPATWVERLTAAGYVTPTETQARALPPLLAGRHVIIKGETGSGKTLAYLLPVLAAVRERWIASRGAPSGTRATPPQYALAAVVVPTQELVHQVLRVATALAPECASMFRGVYSDRGVSRSEGCALIVGTPGALRDNVNYKHLDALRYLVLDEADMLLSGSYFPVTQGFLLARYKQREPATRPQHVFCAATLPTQGRLSVATFLDTYYPPEEVQRIVTRGAHKALPACRQVFVQLDADLPATAAEAEAAARLAAKATAAAAAAVGSRRALPGARAPGASSDAVAAAMAERGDEDRELALRADAEARATRLLLLRRHALLEALLAPTADEDAGATAAGASGAPRVAPPPPPPRLKRRSAALLGVDRRDDADVASIAAPAAEESATAAEADAGGAASSAAGSGGSGAPTVTVRVLRTPHALRAALRDEEAARVPPTLVFCNSAEAAEATRKWLATVVPGVRVGALHRRVEEEERGRVLAGFAAGAVRILVCTDVASRGLDTTGVRHVIQEDMAGDVVTHLHRIGRTARAGAAGLATSLYTRPAADLVAAVAAAAAAGGDVDDAFSRRRSFRKRMKAAVVSAAEDAAVMQQLEAEEAARTTT